MELSETESEDHYLDLLAQQRKKMRLQKIIKRKLENIMNQQIFFQRNYPMPGRHINLSFQINF